MRSGVLKRGDNVKRGRGRPRLTWDEMVKRDLKEWNIAKELAMDRSVWRLAINVPELTFVTFCLTPNSSFGLCPFCVLIPVFCGFYL
jgi:hypothetical protein